MSINEMHVVIQNPLTDEALKQMISLMEMYLNESLYESIKKSKNNKPFEYESTIKNLFVQFINRFINYDRETIEKMGNKQFLDDYDLIKDNYNSLMNMPLNELFSSDLFTRINYKPIYPQSDGSRYIHIKDLGYSEPIECRIYMCPNPESTMKICELIVEKHKKYNVPFYYKINTNSNDNDRIVMYSSYDSFPIHSKIIKEIQTEYPQLFEQSEKNISWSNITDCENMYFGSEPYRSGFESYSQRLCGTIEHAYRDFKILNNGNNNFDLNQFKDYLHYELLKNNIDPENPAFNYSSKHVDSVNDGITQINYNSEQYQIYVCPLISKDECRITIDPLGFYSLNIPKQNIEMLYEKDLNDANYEESESYRHQVIEKLLELKFAYENEPKTELYQTDYSGNRIR